MNRLGSEASPYLRQHADNPVDWWPWGAEAFEEARSSDRPILLSVGYSSCHWCHVMAHESFEDAETAASMNSGYVNIKVDREERPDIDAIYMDATQAQTGHGGWPMTVFMTPEGEPFFCGTYYPSTPRSGVPTFRQVLAAVSDAWENRRDDITEQASRLTEHVRRDIDTSPDGATIGEALFTAACDTLVEAADHVRGGFGGAPKFPQSMSIDVLLDRYRRDGDTESLTVALTALDAMAAGGIYDHLGGGFARYSVDAGWLVPHFEKMLYDQALLLRPYLHAYQLTGESRFAQTIEETISYVASVLSHPGGGFYSSEDADSLDTRGDSTEGAFYTWTLDELREALDDGAEEAAAFWGVTEAGNFEGRNILFRPAGDIARPPGVDELRRRLHTHRERRPRPGLDDKVLTEWNTLMIASLAECGSAMDRPDWVHMAVRSADFCLDHLKREDGRWLRSYQDDSGATHLACAQDYGALLDAFIRLYEATGSLRWLAEAERTADGLIGLFWDADGAGVFTTGSDADPLVARPKDVMDNATPSANSLAAHGLIRLAHLTDRPADGERGEAIVAHLASLLERAPSAFGHLLAAAGLVARGVTEVVVCGERDDMVTAVWRRWTPQVVLAWGKRGTGPLWEDRRDGRAYVCSGFVCRAPTSDATVLVEQLG